MISAVVVNWNGKQYLPDCLDALLAQDPAPDEVLLVDNHSEDGSREFVAERYPAVKILDTGYNAGPAYARNMGVEAASHERVLLVDNDVVLQAGCLRVLSAELETAGEDCALVQARALCADDPEVVHYDATDLHYLGLLVLHNWFVPRPQARAPEESNGGLVALCFLCRRSTYRAVGGFEPAYFILFEDSDLAWRLRLRGQTLRLCPEALVLHGGGTASLSVRGAEAGRAYPARRVYLHSRNRPMLLLTCMSLRGLILSAPAQLAYELLQGVFALSKGHPWAWLRGKFALLGQLRRILQARSAAQAGRRVPDRQLLVAGPLSLNPGVGRGGALHRFLDTCFSAWWKLVRGLSG